MPPGLTVAAVRKAIEYVERELADFVAPTCSLELRRPVPIWRVDVIFVEKSDWKYEGSKAGAGGGGRTHTFGLRKPASLLRDKAVYHRADVRLTGGKAVPRNGE